MQSFARFLAFASGVASWALESRNESGTVPTVHFPLSWKYGRHKISTTLNQPWAPNMTIEVVFDQGSENFWVFGPDAINNWGCTGLLCRGPCNASVPTYYDYTRSPNATAPAEFPFFNGYGAYTKVVYGDYTVNDTMHFSNVAGEQSTTPEIRVALVDLMVRRQADDGTCTPSSGYDLGILGTAPFQRSALWNTTGPSVRHDLLQSGAISAATQSMWMDKPPSDLFGTYTGGAIFGGIDTSKFTGPLVRIKRRMDDTYGEGEAASVGYYTALPNITANGVLLPNDTVPTRTCLIDSGTTNDDLPISGEHEQAFFDALGLAYSPVGYLSYNGSCNQITDDMTFDLTFPGEKEGESVTIRQSLRNYVRANADALEGWCALEMTTGGCTLGAPFASSAFFAADDEAGTMALAQGGVSERGSGPSYDDVVLRLP